MRARRIYILFYFFCYTLPCVYAQGGEAWPKLVRSYINHYYQENDSHSKKCFKEIFFDEQGRLCLIPCGLEILLNSIGLYRFDGYSFHPVEIFTAEGPIMPLPWVRGINEQGQILGTNGEKQLFTMDSDIQVGRIVLPADSSFHDLQVLGLATGKDTTFVLGRSAGDEVALFNLREDKLIKEPSFDFPKMASLPEDYRMVVSPESIWLTTFSLPLYRFDRQEGTIHAYNDRDFVDPIVKLSDREIVDGTERPRLLMSPKGNTYLLFSVLYEKSLFQLDQEENKFQSMADQFPTDWIPVDIFQDETGNICFLFKDKSETYRAVLETVNGQRFDYSSLVSGHSAIEQLAGKDFRRQAFLLTDTGVFCIGIREQDMIRQAITDQRVSSMTEMPDGRLLVNTIYNNWMVYDETTGVATPFQGPDCGTGHLAFGRGMKQQIIPDSKGNLWFIAYNYLVRFDPVSNECESFDFGVNGSLFAFVREELVVFQYDRHHISFINLHTQQRVSFGPGVQETFDGFVRDILVDSNGIVWVPTNNGLWKIDIDRRESEVLGLEQGFPDFRFTTIFEDARGRLWLGTYFGGLHIYDPRTGTVTIIDQGRGLSNNTIMSIISDEDGDMWVGTEYGINLVSKEGEVRYSIHEQDGLTTEVFERFDPFKGKDGYLYFGSRRGISLINPDALKASMNSDTTVQVYLTELGYFDKKQEKDVVLKSHFQQIDRLEISPERPYLHLKFGLSSYLEPHNNRYAYLLEGKDEDWKYLGTQPELNISRLPPGKYRLLIKGADFRNNWTEVPLAINIHAGEFFYKQPWFYLLAAFPFVVFGLIWALNKQQEALRLEREVAQRTQKIREDKAVIEQQAAELRQLDTMKSRFFTNISHELRTPITLIKAPLENLIQKHGASIDKGIGRSLNMVLNNAGKLVRLVEELLELSRLEASKAELKQTSTPLRLFCRQLFDAYESGAALKNINYRFHSNLKEEVHFLVDRNRLEKIVNNLLSNALKFTPKGGNVELWVMSDKLIVDKNDYPIHHSSPIDYHSSPIIYHSSPIIRAPSLITIQVTDNGRGIPPEDLPHLFDRYFQTRRDDIATEGGTGIGLALSKELAHLMSGDLTVESKWGGGACFTLRFPTKEAPPEADYLPLPVANHRPEGNGFDSEISVTTDTEKQKTKVLIVEDNQSMQELIVTLLSDQYDCVLANNGAEAWIWLNGEHQDIDDIQLILSDVMMPEMDGYTLLKKIKAHERWQKLPVVMLTARSAEEDKLQALRMGVDDYLLKPFSPEELKARLQNLIANYQVRKNIAVSVEESVEGVDIAFESEQSAHTTWLKEVEDAAREALDKGLRLSTTFLAERVFSSERQFSRKLKVVTGLTPIGYIQEVKLQKARHLLENQIYLTVNEVAQAAGYSSGSYLNKVYQERFGKKPSDYF